MLRDPEYLKHLRSERCVITGRRGSDSESVVAAHIGTAGKGIKSPDNQALPLLDSVHHECHQKGEMSTFRRHLPDGILRLALQAYAEKLYREWHGE